MSLAHAIHGGAWNIPGALIGASRDRAAPCTGRGGLRVAVEPGAGRA